MFDSLVESTGKTTYPTPGAAAGSYLDTWQKDRNAEKALE